MSARLVVASLLLACACARPAAPATIIGNQPGPLVADDAPADGLRDGALWTCQIDDYDPQPCRLARDGRAWSLAKLLGSQRFRGAVVFGDGGARLTGEFFCPWGDCTMPLDVAFEREGDGYVSAPAEPSAVAPPTLRFRYDAADDAAFGGAGYGRLTGTER